MLELESVRTDLFQLSESVVDIVKYPANQKDLEVLLDIDYGMPRYAMVDPVRLKQVLANLLGNAVKFTERGEVSLTVRFQAGENGKGQFTFSVRDTGIGISEEHSKKLFRAFTHADSSTTRKFGGTGLGLIISETIAKKMGGSIQLNSQSGKGSTFTFSFPSQVEDSPTEEEAPLDQIKRCLVIDDNAQNQLILQNMLQHWKIETICCDDGLSALQVLEGSAPFDLIIVDYHMPYLNGLETIGLMRDKLKMPPDKPPIVLLHSSSDDPSLYQSCQKIGVHLLLTKPVKSDELVNHLQSLRVPHIQNKEEHFDQITFRERIDNNESLYQELIGSSITLFPLMIAELESHQDDMIKTRAVAHKLKGSSLSICFPMMAIIAGKIEKSAQECDSLSIFTLREELKKEWDNVLLAIEE